MEKRYQVFLSSTYEDLKEERLEVMKALIELDCFPCGMEYFPAASEDQWTYIRELIDQCDYYVVILAGRYGSTDPTGMSYTEKEYRYALERNIPVIAFTHGSPGAIPAAKTEKSAEAKARLEQFQTLVRTRLCKDWTTAAELGALVSRSLTQLIKRHPRRGWLPADHIASADASDEILRLRQTIDRLEAERVRLSFARPTGSESLAQGSDHVDVDFTLTFARGSQYPRLIKKGTRTATFTWDELFESFAPYLLVPVNITNIKTGLNRLIRSVVTEYEEDLEPEAAGDDDLWSLSSVVISERHLQRVIIQFSALGLIEMHSVQDGERERRTAVLTPLGKQELLRISAVKRSNAQQSAELSGDDEGSRAT